MLNDQNILTCLIWTLFLGNVYSICRVKGTEGHAAMGNIFHIQELGKVAWAEPGGKILCNFLLTLSFVMRVLEHRRSVEIPKSNCLTIMKKLMNPQMEIFY